MHTEVILICTGAICRFVPHQTLHKFDRLPQFDHIAELNSRLMAFVCGWWVSGKIRPKLDWWWNMFIYVKDDYTFTVSKDMIVDDVEALSGELDSRSLQASIIRCCVSMFISLSFLIGYDWKWLWQVLDMIMLGYLNYEYVINESKHSNHFHSIESLYDMSELMTEKTRVF